MNYKVIKNFLPKKVHKEIQTIMTAGNFPWYYCDSGGDPTDTERYYFIHIFKTHEKINSDFWNPIMVPILERFQPKEIYRVRGNLTPKEEKNYESSAHTDEIFKHKVALYYVNTNNGYTLIEDKIKIPSIANSCLFFDGHLSHKAVSQTDEKIRVNVNITYI